MSRSSALAAPLGAVVHHPIAFPDVDPLRADLIGDVRRSLAALAEADITGLADGASVLALQECQSVLESVLCRQAEAFDRYGNWSVVGAKSSPAWVTTQSRGEARQAKRRLRIGRWLRIMPRTEAVFRSGTIGTDHVQLLVRVRSNAGTMKHFGEAEPMLVEWATTLKFEQFKALVDEWTIHVDPDGAETQAERDHANRRVHLSQSLDNQWFLDGFLDPISGEIINNALSAIDRELFEADWAAAKKRLGHQPTIHDLDRTGSQRSADALVAMAGRSAAMPAGSREPKPLFTILVGEQSFARTCVLASGTVIPPGLGSQWLMNSTIERVIYDAPDRVMAVSERRLFTGALRRAIEVRDRTCTHPYCDEPVERCEVDHIRPRAHGGPTSLDNGRLRCGFHNRLEFERTGNTQPVGDRPPDKDGFG